jgi:hypothetical protein
VHVTTPTPNIGSAATTSLLQYGVLGLVVLALAWFAWTTIQRERRRSEDLDARLQALHDSVRTEVVPAVTRATEALARITELLPEMIAATKSGRS